MSSPSREKLIEKVSREQRAFNEQVGALLPEHLGEFVLFNNGSPVEFYDGFEEAFRQGLERFGLEGGFLVSEVKKLTPQSVALNWELGVPMTEG